MSTRAGIAKLQRQFDALKLEKIWDNLIRDMDRWTNAMKHIKGDHERKVLREMMEANSFLLEQYTQRSVRIGFVQKAIMMASTDYNAILATAASKKLDIDGIVMFAAFTLLPELGALGALFKTVGEQRDAIQQLVTAVKVIGKGYDFGTKLEGSTPATQGPKALKEPNEVLAKVYDSFLHVNVLMANVVSAFTEMIRSGNLANPYQTVLAQWKQAGLDVWPPAKFEEEVFVSEVLRNVILYDMLRAYTKKYVTMRSKAPTPSYILPEDVARGKLEDFPSGAVSVDGFNDNQRELIYSRFSTVLWKDSTRPPINSWRDLIKHWGART